MSKKKDRTLWDDVKRSAIKQFQVRKKKPSKSDHEEASTAGAATTTRPGVAGPSGVINQTHHDQGPEQRGVRDASGASSVVSPEPCTSEEAHHVQAGSSSVLKSSQEELNYSRLCRLLISVGSRVLRDTFDSIIPPGNLREFLKREPANSRLQLLRKKGVLTSVHWLRLDPAIPTEVSSASFDIPLLIVLLRTICNLSPPRAGWDIPPLTADTSRESDIARIKYFMKALFKHNALGSVSHAVFSSYWQQIRDTLVRLGGADYQDVVDEMKDQDIEFFDGEHFRELLKQWKKVEDEIKEKLNELETEAYKGADPGTASSASITFLSGVGGPLCLTRQTHHHQDPGTASSASITILSGVGGPLCLTTQTHHHQDSYNVNSAQELSARERQEIIDVLKGHARWNTENHKFFKPTDVVHITKVYNLTLESLGMNEDLSLESANFKTEEETQIEERHMGEDYYTRGFCLIIINRKFGDATKSCNGSEIDAEQLEKLFKGVLFFTVRVERDLRRDQMLDLAIQFSQQDFSRYGAFVFIIMSHGSERTPVCGVDDESIEIGLLMSQFTATKCPSLKNKPKLFFIQTYSGKLEEPLSPNKRDASSVAICDLSYCTDSRIPIEADFLVSFANAPGYKNAWPFPGFGSPFIRKLVRAIREYHHRYHLVDILSSVNQLMVDEGIQVSAEFCLTLRKKLWL